jgi:hypothetical protein
MNSRCKASEVGIALNLSLHTVRPGSSVRQRRPIQNSESRQNEITDGAVRSRLRGLGLEYRLHPGSLIDCPAVSMSSDLEIVTNN